MAAYLPNDICLFKGLVGTYFIIVAIICAALLSGMVGFNESLIENTTAPAGIVGGELTTAAVIATTRIDFDFSRVLSPPLIVAVTVTTNNNDISCVFADELLSIFLFHICCVFVVSAIPPILRKSCFFIKMFTELPQFRIVFFILCFCQI